jgi:hypothetical protein
MKPVPPMTRMRTPPCYPSAYQTRCFRIPAGPGRRGAEGLPEKCPAKATARCTAPGQSVESRMGASTDAGAPPRFPSPLISRVEDWRRMLRRLGLSVTPCFLWECLTSGRPARLTGQSRKELAVIRRFRHPGMKRQVTEVSRPGSGVLQPRSLAWLQVPCAKQW